MQRSAKCQRPITASSALTSGFLLFRRFLLALHGIAQHMIFLLRHFIKIFPFLRHLYARYAMANIDTISTSDDCREENFSQPALHYCQIFARLHAYLHWVRLRLIRHDDDHLTRRFRRAISGKTESAHFYFDAGISLPLPFLEDWWFSLLLLCLKRRLHDDTLWQASTAHLSFAERLALTIKHTHQCRADARHFYHPFHSCICHRRPRKRWDIARRGDYADIGTKFNALRLILRRLGQILPCIRYSYIEDVALLTLLLHWYIISLLKREIVAKFHMPEKSKHKIADKLRW